MPVAILDIPRRSRVGQLRRLGRRVMRRIVLRPLQAGLARTSAMYWSVIHEPQIRRLLSTAVPPQRRALVVGPSRVVARALPWTTLDVVGTDPQNPYITVVSAADEEGTLPRRWDYVIVTDANASVGRLRAAVGACLPNGTVAVVARHRARLWLGDHGRAPAVSRAHTVALHVVRVAA